MKKMIGIAMAGIMMFATAGCVFADVTVDEAKKTALEAAGVTEEQVIFKNAEEEMDDDVKIFDIDFFVPGEVKYEFDIAVSDGRILEQDVDLWEADDDMEYADLINANDDKAADKKSDGEITELQAKAIALKDAGFKMSDVTFTKCKKDTDDGVVKYEVEFRTNDGVDNEYDIKVADGTIIDKDVDVDD